MQISRYYNVGEINLSKIIDLMENSCLSIDMCFSDMSTDKIFQRYNVKN